MKSCEIFLLLKIRTMATNFSPCKGSYVLNQFPSNVMFGMNGFHVSASGAIQGHHGPLVHWVMALSWNFLSALFSSPEHKVLMVSFCDRPMSGVRRPSCVVHNFFKHLLLLNHWANLDETWQGCSLGEALPKLFKRLNSNSGCHGNQKEKNSKIFENLLLWN